MYKRPQLVLDIGGVLFTNLDYFWENLTNETNISYEQLRSRYKQQVSEPLWTGKISEQDFWIWIANHPNMTVNKAREFMIDSLIPLPALQYLEQWSKYTTIHLLSNHRSEWVNPALKPYSHYIKSKTISSDIMVKKPQLAAYHEVTKYLDRNRAVLFVDDKQQNLVQARKLGWNTLSADEGGHWVHKVIPILVANEDKE